jgi:hypothetical protein
MPTTSAARTTAALLALLTWATLALRLYLSIADALAKGLDLAPVIIGYCSFFTILSNLLVACVCTRIAFTPDRSSPNLEAATAVYIAVVGLGYSLLLRHIWNPQGLEKVADVLLHDLVPLLYVVYWVLFRSKRKPLPWTSTLIWLIWPAIYFVYTMIRGALTGIYAYHFLDPAPRGYAHVVIMGSILFVAFVVLGLAAIALTRRNSTQIVIP